MPDLPERFILTAPDSAEPVQASPADVPAVPTAPSCGATYGRVRCYRPEGHSGTHAGVSKLEWG